MPRSPKASSQPSPPPSSPLAVPQPEPGKALLALPQVRLLSPAQVELALSWIASPILSPPPQELEHLSQLEWFVLSRFLQTTLSEKESSPLQ